MNINVPDGDKSVIFKIIELCKGANTAVISWHARPDGDAIGAGLALRKILKALNVDVEVVSPTPPASAYKFLKDFSVIKTWDKSKRKNDIALILDCSDIGRLEKTMEILDSADIVINIDHHQYNTKFGDINYVRPFASSVSELILNIAIQASVEIDYDIATYIYVGILTDTNRFQEQNTTPEAHKIAAWLIEKFISPIKIYSLIYGKQELKNLYLLKEALQSLKRTASGKIAYITITPKILEKTHTNDENLEGIINYARNINGVEVGVLFRKVPYLSGIKVSFRSKGKVNVSRVAGRFGGGGHHNAAGCLVQGEFREVHQQIIDELEKEMDKEGI